MGTGLARCAGELKKTNAMLAKLEADVDALKHGKAEAAHLDKLRGEVGKMVHEATTAVAGLRQTVGTVVNDVKEHFRTASQTIAATNAAFVSDVRDKYQAELAQTATLRGEVQEFMLDVERKIAGLDSRVGEAAARAAALAAEGREEMKELNARRSRDKTSSDNELKALKRRLGGVFDNSDKVLRGIDHIYKVLRMMLESEAMQCSLELQDTDDRRRIALMGVKDDDMKRPEFRAKSAPCGSAGLNDPTPPPRGVLRGGPGSNKSSRTQVSRAPQEVVRVDNRCLSCSGQAPFVLAHFKMACLHWQPSPVDHDGKHHDRTDLLQRRHHVLRCAREALQEVPGTDAATASSATGLGESNESAGHGAFAAYATTEARLAQTDANAYTGRLPSVPTPRLVSAR